MTFGGKDNRGPSIAELQRYVREKVSIAFVLSTGENIIGKLRWFDENAFSIAQDGQQPFTILRSAVVGYRKHGDEPTGGSAVKGNTAGGADIMSMATTAPRADQAVVGASQAHNDSLVANQQDQQTQPSTVSTQESRTEE
jgi:hypothetical protein